jgi:hypothetical protein
MPSIFATSELLQIGINLVSFLYTLYISHWSAEVADGGGGWQVRRDQAEELVIKSINLCFA